MYRNYKNNDIYSNSSNSSNNGTWVYINGELYHAGVKGMHWYQHLPGTDWWKMGKDYYNYYKGNNNGVKSKIGAGVRALGSTAKTAAKAYGVYLKNEASYYGNKAKTAAINAYGKVKTGVSKAYTAAKNGTSKFYNAAKGYTQEKINAMKESARNHYQKVKTNVHDILDRQHGRATEVFNNPYLLLSEKGDGTNYLNDWVMSDVSKSVGKYSNALANGPIGNMFNSLIFDTKVNAKAAAAKLLDRLGLDDEVDRLIKKFSNKSK